jgi:transposase
VVGVAAVIGTTERSPDPQHLIAYLGLNPSVCQSGQGPAYYGRITKQGCVHAPGMLARRPGLQRDYRGAAGGRRG